MTVMTLLIDRRGTRVALANTGVVEVRYEDGETHKIGLAGLRRIIVQGDAQLSASLLRACSAAGVAVILVAGRGRGEPAHLFPAPRGTILLRHAQHRCYADPVRRLDIARALVRAKIQQQVLWLDAHGEGSETVSRFLAQAESAAGINELMGVEGAAAARYFSVWSKCWRNPWHFSGRNRRPPRDPVNSLLSLGYALALNHVGRRATLSGLDLALGFLHAPFPQRPSLALDLLEPVRPWVDQWVWRLLESGALKPADFTDRRQEGCRLSKEGRGVFFREWHINEDDWLPKPARHALAIVLSKLRPFKNRTVLQPDEFANNPAHEFD